MRAISTSCSSVQAANQGTLRTFDATLAPSLSAPISAPRIGGEPVPALVRVSLAGAVGAFGMPTPSKGRRSLAAGYWMGWG